MTTKKSKLPTLRQQLRDKASPQLAKLMAEMRMAATKVVEGSSIHPTDLMGICCKTQVATLHDHLITVLANDAEAELVKLWNDQQKLELGESDAD